MNAVEESIHDNHINVFEVVFPHLRVFVSLVERSGGVEGGGKGRAELGQESRRAGE